MTDHDDILNSPAPESAGLIDRLDRTDRTLPRAGYAPDARLGWRR